MNLMKCSISMSSLESPSKYMRTPDGSKKAWNTMRPCNSLSSKKPRRSHEMKLRRRSWESAEELSPEDLWKACLQSVQGLVDSGSADDLEFLPVKDFLEDYARIREWLNSVQVERGRFADSVKLSELAETLRKKLHIRVEMIEKAKLLVRKFPKMKEEFHWRIKHMNSQWDALEKILLCQKSMNSATYHVPTENATEECDIKWVRNWLRKMENELQPLAFNVQWTAEKLEEELIRHKALQTEIEAKSPAVHSVLRQCQSQGQSEQNLPHPPPPRKRRGDILEKRWIQLRLRVLEWVEHLSTIQKSEEHQNKQGRRNSLNICPGSQHWENIEVDENQEPLSKYPRLCDSPVTPEDINLEEAYYPSKVDLANNQEGFNDLDWVMGQSHESGSVYQSGSPVPNTTLEFHYEGISGMKRKLSTLQSPVTAAAAAESMNPTNISTYYFKHSDTEPEHHHATSTPLLRQTHEIQTHSSVTINNVSSIGSLGVRPCQKSLDFSQCSSPQEERFNFKRLSQFIPSEGEEEESLEFGIDLFLQDMESEEDSNSNYHPDLQNLNEIEELVQQAELLAKLSFGANAGSGAAAAAAATHRRDEWAEEGGELISHRSSGFAFTASAAASTGYSSNTGRKCSLLHGVVPPTPLTLSTSATTTATSTISRKLRKSTKNGNLSLSLMEGTEERVQRGEGVESEQQHIVESTKHTSTSTKCTKVSKKNARVRQWVRAHNNNGHGVGAAIAPADHKNTSSCDASAESATESDSEVSHSEQHLSSDDPTTLSASTAFLHPSASILEPHGNGTTSSLRKGASATNINQLRSPAASTSGGTTTTAAAASGPGIVWRSKKRNTFGKQRPKSFTDTFGSQCVSNFGPSTTTTSSLLIPRKQKSCFVSDSALNFIGNNSLSSSSGSSPSNSDTKKKVFKRKLLKQKKRSLDFLEDETGVFHPEQSTSFCGEGLESLEGQVDLENQSPKAEGSKPLFFRLSSDRASVNTDELLQSNDQDWDSYQEKYLSEPYSEEPYDQDRTLKLLAFGEDYDQVLGMADSESSSMLSGFEPNPRKRRPLTLVNRGEMPESDSDREEFNHFLNQSVSQLRLIDVILRKQISGSADLTADCPTEFAEMEATCEENINSLKLILGNIEKPDALPFQIDIRTIQGVLERWHILKEKIIQASKLQRIQEEMDILRKEFDTVTCNLEEVDPFDSRDLNSLHYKIEQIQGMLNDLAERKKRLQSLNEASVGTQLFLKESGVISDVKKQLEELYTLYEENFQLGSYVLGKMKYLQEAWESFESEKSEFEKTMSTGILRPKLRKELSSAASTDSGHGTDFSHDSSISDSDMDFKERRQKLVALKKRATDLKEFLPPGSPVSDVIEMKLREVQRDFENLRKSEDFDPSELKIIYPSKRSPTSKRRTMKSPKLATIRSGSVLSTSSKSRSQSPSPLKKEPNRNWRIIRLSLTFHLALMGLFAVAWFLQPRCCENSNTFSFCLVPHLTHERIPHI